MTRGDRLLVSHVLGAALVRAPGAPGADLARALIDVHARADGDRDARAMDSRTPPSVAAILAAVSRASGVGVREMLGMRRRDTFVKARQMAAYLACRLTALSLPQIGRALDRDHTTVMHSDARVSARLAAGCAGTAALERAALAALGAGEDSRVTGSGGRAA